VLRDRGATSVPSLGLVAALLVAAVPLVLVVWALAR
jgi:hypothetical protein